MLKLLNGIMELTGGVSDLTVRVYGVIGEWIGVSTLFTRLSLFFDGINH